MTNFLTVFFTGVSEATAPLLIFLTLLFTGVYAYRRDYIKFANFLLPILITFGLCSILKFFVHEERPHGHTAAGYSFPSEHTALAMSVWLSVWYQTIGGWRYFVACMIFPLLTALSRVYLHEHFWWDVLSGASLATLVFLTYRDMFCGTTVELFE